MEKQTLSDMFQMQKILQIRLDNAIALDSEYSQKKQEYININVLALMSELDEVLRETPWKPWKKQQVFNKEKYKMELVDLFHFFMNLCIAGGMDADELYKLYCEKNAENFRRQDENY